MPSSSTSAPQGLEKFLAELAGAYGTKHSDTIDDAQKNLLSALKADKKITVRKEKEEEKFVQGFETLGLGKEGETGLEDGGKEGK